jgi:plastocyanin
MSRRLVARAAGIAFVVLVALVALVALAGCGSASTPANEVDMGVAAFQQASVTISAGQAVHFVDPLNGGGTHVICVGANMQCAHQPGAPAALDTTSGITFNAGDPARDIVFPTPGTYQVVCTIHPNMVVTVVVR